MDRRPDGTDGGDEEEEEEESGDDWAHFVVASALMFLSEFLIQESFFLAIWVWKIHPLHLTVLAFFSEYLSYEDE